MHDHEHQKKNEEKRQVQNAKKMHKQMQKPNILGTPVCTKQNLINLPPTQDSSHHQKNITRLWKLNLYL